MTAIQTAPSGTIAALIQDIPAGTRHEGWLDVGEKASGAKIAIPFILFKGARPGPALWINGQVHGNEVTAIVAALKLLDDLNPADVSGTIIFTATGQPLALDNRTMFSPQDWANLDQSFPGRPGGFITERLAHRLWSEIDAVRPDLLISMHAQGTEADSSTYAVFKQPPECTVAPERIFPFIRLFDPFVVCRMRVEPGSGEIPGNHAGALDYQAMASGIPAFMVELGTGLRARPADVAEGVGSFRKALARLGIIAADGAAAAEGLAESRLVTRRGHVMVGRGGFFLSERKPGEIIPAGEPIGTVMNIHGRQVEVVTAEEDVLIIAIRIDPVVHSGDNVAYVAYQWEGLSLGEDDNGGK